VEDVFYSEFVGRGVRIFVMALLLGIAQIDREVKCSRLNSENDN
jgi:hypothetical protein